MQRSGRNGRRGLRTWGAAGLLLVLAACGSSGGGSSPKSDGTPRSSGGTKATAADTGKGKGQVDVCAVITPADAAALFGESAEAQSSPSPEPLVSGICLYSHPGDPLDVRNLLQVRVYPGEQFYGAQLFPSATELTGFGDKGFVAVNAKTHKIDLQFVKGGRTGVIAYTTGGGVDIAAREDAVRTIGKKLAAAM